MKRYQPRHSLYVLIFPNGKRYYGYSCDEERRWREHEQTARLGKSPLLVSRAIRRHGWVNVKKQLVLIGPLDYVLEMEEKAIAAYNTLAPNGYNVAPGGKKAPSSNPDVGAKISIALVEHFKDPARRAHMSAVNTGRVMTAEQNSKNSAAKVKNWKDPKFRAAQIKVRTGKKNSAETKQRKSVSIKEAWARDLERHTRQSQRFQGNDYTLGMVWINDGFKNKMIKESGVLPEGFKLGMLSTHMIGRKIITNGSNERRIYPNDPLPDGWWFGRLPNVKFGPKAKAD